MIHVILFTCKWFCSLSVYLCVPYQMRGLFFWQCIRAGVNGSVSIFRPFKALWGCITTWRTPFSLTRSSVVIQEVGVLDPPPRSHNLFSSIITLGAWCFERAQKKCWSQAVKEWLEGLFTWILLRLSEWKSLFDLESSFTAVKQSLK